MYMLLLCYHFEAKNVQIQKTLYHCTNRMKIEKDNWKQKNTWRG